MRGCGSFPSPSSKATTLSFPLQTQRQRGAAGTGGCACPHLTPAGPGFPNPPGCSRGPGAGERWAGCWLLSGLLWGHSAEGIGVSLCPSSCAPCCGVSVTCWHRQAARGRARMGACSSPSSSSCSASCSSTPSSSRSASGCSTTSQVSVPRGGGTAGTHPAFIHTFLLCPS